MSLANNLRLSSVALRGRGGGFSVSGLPIWSAAVRNMLAGGADAIMLAGPGDSTTAGALSNATAALYRSNGWPPQIAANLTTNKGLPAKWDNCFGTAVNDAQVGTIGLWDNRIINTSGFSTTDVTSGYTLGGKGYIAGGAGTLRYTTIGSPIDTIDIYFLSQSNVSATFTINVGGSSLGTFGGITTPGFNKATVTVARAIYDHININWVSGSFVLPIAYDCRDSTQKTIRIQNVAFGGALSSDWTVTTNPWNTLAAVPVLLPKLCIISLGINDWISAVPVATYQANLTAIVSACQAAGSDIVLVTPFPSGVVQSGISVATQNTFVAAMQAVAASKGCQVADFNAAAGGTWAAANASGLAAADGFHPNFAGYTVMSNTILAKITP